MSEIQPIYIGIIVILQALSIFIIKLILENSIKFEFKKREQAAIIASLFAEWIDNPKERKDLNRLAWEATLWLPDNLAKEVNKRLANEPEAKKTKEILVSIKELIQGHKSSLNPAEIVHFPKKEEPVTQINIKQVDGLEEKLKKIEERLDKLEKLSPKYDKDNGTMNFQVE